VNTKQQIKSLNGEIEILRSMLRESEANTGTRIASVSVHVASEDPPRMQFIITAPTVLSEESFGRYVGAQVAAGLDAIGLNVRIVDMDASTCAPEGKV
jgi:hypothetical protein